MTGVHKRFTAALAAGLVAQLVIAGVSVGARLHSHRDGGQARLTIGAGGDPQQPVLPKVQVPVPSPRPLPSVRVRRPVHPPAKVRLPKRARLPQLPPVPLPSGCPALAHSRPQPTPSADWALSSPHMDGGAPLLVGDTLWYSVTSRDGKFETHLIGVNIRTGTKRVTQADPFFRFSAAVGDHAWGIDNNGVAEFDLTSGAVSRRWSSFTLPTQSGHKDATPAYLTSDGTTIYVVLVANPNAGVAAVDISSGSTKWTTVLPHDEPGSYSGGLHSGIAVAPQGIYVALTDPDYHAGIHVSRLTTGGKLLADQAVTIPLVINESPGLAVGSNGVYVTLFGSAGQQDGRLIALDPISLRQRASVAVQVLEGVFAGPGGVWTISLPCNTFLLTRYDPDTLHRTASYRLPSMSYEIDASSQTVWVLVTKSPLEPIRLEGLAL